MAFLFRLVIVSLALVCLHSYQPIPTLLKKNIMCVYLAKERNESKGFGPKKVIAPNDSASYDKVQVQRDGDGNLVSPSLNDDEMSTKPIDTAPSSIKSTATDSKDIDKYMYDKIISKKEILLEEKIRALREQEFELSQDLSVGAVPELVANRMIGRIVSFLGVPVFLGMSIFVGSVVAAKKFDTVVPPYLIAYATQVPFIIGLIGISYAILSSSWDEQEGSMLGFNEFKINLQRIKDGFDREKDTAKLKDEIERETTRLRKK
jgi:hypothetical protein